MKVFCAGPESSGNYWLRGILSQHPEMEVGGDSFPSCMGADRHYPQPTDYDTLVVIVRDQNCQLKSVEDHGYNEGNEGKFTREETINALTVLIEQSSRVVFVSYESALVWRRVYWAYILKLIGVGEYDFDVEYKDGNAKYMKA